MTRIKVPVQLGQPPLPSIVSFVALFLRPIPSAWFVTERQSSRTAWRAALWLMTTDAFLSLIPRIPPTLLLFHVGSVTLSWHHNLPKYPLREKEAQKENQKPTSSNATVRHVGLPYLDFYPVYQFWSQQPPPGGTDPSASPGSLRPHLFQSRRYPCGGWLPPGASAAEGCSHRQRFHLREVIRSLGRCRASPARSRYLCRGRPTYVARVAHEADGHHNSSIRPRPCNCGAGEPQSPGRREETLPGERA